MSKGTKTPQVVVAATRDDTAFKAVALRRSDGSAELLWSKRMPADGGTWNEFAAQCGLASAASGSRATVVGLDSTAVVFYKISTPHVGKEETAAIVRMQAESLLPLPQDQIEVAWRTAPSTNGTVDVTIAAARRDYLHRFAQDIRAFDPRNILPACEGTVRAWQELFTEGRQHAVVLSIGASSSQISLVGNGLVINAAVLDTGMNDLAADPDPTSASGSVALSERYAHDIRTVLESLAWKEAASRPLFVLSDGGGAIESVIAALRAAELDAKASLPKAAALRVPPDFGSRDVYEYRVPLGLALMRLDAPPRGLDLLERIAEARQQEQAKSAWYSTALAAALAVVMLAALIVVAYFIDVASEKRLTALVSQPPFKEAAERQALLRTVARHRPDMLGLLTELSAGENNGIVLDDFHFKKGQLASISGRADNMEQMWKYQANLLDQKNIKDVEITSQSQDAKSKKITFTMAFHYKNFTKKGGSL
ncbi:MAG: hypothetical protein JW993_11835 [Sedimentisphaerales bacterium]|nr:hypothetical protein [Sedimentisphaerales bacterium]